ncbi:hypothetical protein K439DRAFT_1387877 [Ramaria rubella]|nr:hypothetical protein K439DRAFT_1387877 [Ramaria rubella]
MFYSEAILSRRGPLAKVWLAAHWERKLSKTQTLQTDISQSVGAIMGQEVEVMALRLSGQLLLGVVRIYSRKAKYLLDDCNEALLKIKMAFRPGIVDMTEDQLAVNRNAITLQDGGLDFDLDLDLPDFNLDLDFEAQPGGQHIARQADITLATADDLPLDMDDPGYGFDLGPTDGIGSQDFELDLGLDFGVDFGEGPSNNRGRDDDDLSVEVGRDAPILLDRRASLDSTMLGHGDGDKDLDALSMRSRDASEPAFGSNFDMDLGGDMGLGVDMGMDLDLGLNFGDELEPPIDKEQIPGNSRASSPLTELPDTPPPELTPRAAAKAPGEPSPSKRPSTKRPKEKKQIIDSVIELADGPGAKVGRNKQSGLGSQIQKDVSDILADQHFLPASRTVMRLLEIRADPVAHFMPTKPGPGGSLLFNAGPPGLAPELAALFMRPITNLSLSKRRGEEANDRPKKKPRMEGSVNGDASEVEQARRAGSVARSIGLGSDILPGAGGDVDFGGMDGPVEDYQMDVDFRLDVSGELAIAPDNLAVSKAGDETRLSTPAAEFAEDIETYADADCPIATFDVRPSQSQSTGQPQTQEDEQVDGDERDQTKGYSKNTVKALSIIRKELDPAANPDSAEKVLSFASLSEKASRRAASSFFFELLVLGTRDCVKLSQAGPFENIEIRAKDKLWEHQIRQGRQASAAPSFASSFG